MKQLNSIGGDIRRCSVFTGLMLLFALAQTGYGQALQEVRVEAKATKTNTTPNGMETWVYRVNLANTTSKEQQALEVKWRIYLHSEVTSDGKGKATPDTGLKSLEGSANVATVAPKATASLDTPGMPIAVGNTRVRADKDILKGIWVRVYRDGKEIGSTVQPASLAKKVNWP